MKLGSSGAISEGVQIYTKHFDARKKINAKKVLSSHVQTKSSKLQLKRPFREEQDDSGRANKSRNIKNNEATCRAFDESSSNKPIGSIKKNMNRTNKKTNDDTRELTFTGKSLKICTSNNLVPKDRKAVVKGKTLSIVAKNTSSYKATKQPFNKLTNNTWIGPKLPSAAIEQIAPLKKVTMSAKVVISNLHPSVTHEDILELFGAIGPLHAGCLKSVGNAEVVYHVAEDAFAAYNKYHGRNLDGQPMILKITTTDKGGSVMSTSRNNQYESVSPSSYHHPPSSSPLSVQNYSSARLGTVIAPVVFTVKL